MNKKKFYNSVDDLKHACADDGGNIKSLDSGKLNAKTIAELDIDRLALNDNAPDTDGIAALQIAAEELPENGGFFNFTGRVNASGREALDTVLNRVVSIRQLDSRDAEARRKFIEEARMIASLDHPSISSVYQLCRGKAGEIELVLHRPSGKTLREYLKKLVSIYTVIPLRLLRGCEPKSLIHRLNLFISVCDVISYAHHKGVLHCDLKPENIVIGKFGEVYVLDWSDARQNNAERLDIDPGKTNYIAPEVLSDQGFDIRSDVYTLGLILFDLVFLKPPFPGNAADMSRRVKSHAIRSFRHRFGCRVDNDLRCIVEKAVDPDPFQRYGSVPELIVDVRHYLFDEEVSANADNIFTCLRRKASRRRKLIAAIAGLTVLLLVSTTAGMLYREVTEKRQEVITGNAIVELSMHAYKSAQDFDHSLKNSSIALVGLARETAARLETGEPENTPSHSYSYLDGADAKTAPHDFKYAPAYHQKLAFSTFVYKTSPGVPPPDLAATLRRLQPLTVSLIRIMQGSLTDEEGRQSGELNAKIGTEIKPPVSFIQVSLVNGLHLSYPYHDDYVSSYDPRRRGWFIQALEAKGDTGTWSAPYIDNGERGDLVVTHARKIIDSNGATLGCVAFDLALDMLIERLGKTGNSGDFVIGKQLIDEDGRVVADASPLNAPANREGNISFNYFDDLKLLTMMWKRRIGTVLTTENDRRILNIFMRIESLNWLYLEKIDFTGVLNARK